MKTLVFVIGLLVGAMGGAVGGYFIPHRSPPEKTVPAGLFQPLLEKLPYLNRYYSAAKSWSFHPTSPLSKDGSIEGYTGLIIGRPIGPGGYKPLTVYVYNGKVAAIAPAFSPYEPDTFVSSTYRFSYPDEKLVSVENSPFGGSLYSMERYDPAGKLVARSFWMYETKYEFWDEDYNQQRLEFYADSQSKIYKLNYFAPQDKKWYLFTPEEVIAGGQGMWRRPQASQPSTSTKAASP